MTEIALYRKYRPKAFKEVLGQDHVVSVLEGAIREGNISHAYLFAGSRGTGKTSVARIFADAVGTSANDLYEIDAASNRGIDDVRALREAVNTLPFESRFKVYIIDEAHMLTKEAFNALLKTLEEPPAHVIFVLATTEIDKLPQTIISRCQTFTFKKPSIKVLKDLIAKVAKKEGFALENASAELIALLGDGSFRDAQGILQKIISTSPDKKVSVEEVLIVTGAPRSELVRDFISAVDAKDISKAFSALKRTLEANVEMKVFLKLILQKMRLVLLLRYAPELAQAIKEEVGEDEHSFLNNLALRKDGNISASILSVFLGAYNDVGRSFMPELPIEIALARILDNK